MSWTFTDDPGVFLDAAGAWLAARPAEHTVPLTVTAALRGRVPGGDGAPAPVLGWWRGPDGEVAGTLVQTPPRPPLLDGLGPDAVAALLAARPLTSANADRATALAVAAHWPGHRVDEERRLYRLDGLVPPCPAPPGRARSARPGDRALLVRWHRGFAADLGRPDTEAEAAVDRRLSGDGLTLWEDGGAPVSMAVVSPRVAGAVRVVAVYTPPEHRGRGYAAAVTAQVARTALDGGAEHVLLFADPANPTSNGVYWRIGFRPVADRLVVGAEPDHG
ncbi:GNAT family N-acetyltransferase [Streptomyces sp. NPDC056010]|uniref:GNAT family N-acetyltransferase n=1 Tax=Streptomyces sp. NPDC056010 TaxID=3345679 RepID=UPI0035DA221E